MRTNAHARHYPFAGDTITVAELCRWIPVYNEDRLAQALKAGCDSIKAVMMYLATREYEASRRHRKGTNKGQDTQRRARDASVARARTGK